MQVITNQTTPNTVEITIKESEKNMLKHQRSAADAIAKERQFKGFKKGSLDVPVEVIASEIGAGFLESETLQKALEGLYPKALKKAEVNPVDQGEIKEITSVLPLEVTLQIEVLPEVEMDMKKVAKVQIEKKAVKVTAADVKTDMEKVEQEHTTFEEQKKKDAIKEGDRITIHAHGYDKKDGEMDDRLHLHDFSFVIGSGQMIPGFEDEFIGKKVGDNVSFDITFPKEYHSEDFAGQKRYFDTNVEKVENPKKPEWDEAFIEKIWGKKVDLDTFKKELKDAILKDRENAEQQRVEDAIYDELIKLAKIELGPKLIARETETIWGQHEADLKQRGMDAKAYLDHMGMDKEGFKKAQLESLAIRRLQAQLILEHLRGSLDDVAVSDEDVQAETKEMFASQSDNEDFMKRVEEMYVTGNQHFEELRARLQYRKIIQRFIKEEK